MLAEPSARYDHMSKSHPLWNKRETLRAALNFHKIFNQPLHAVTSAWTELLMEGMKGREHRVLLGIRKPAGSR